MSKLGGSTKARNVKVFNDNENSCLNTWHDPRQRLWAICLQYCQIQYSIWMLLTLGKVFYSRTSMAKEYWGVCSEVCRWCFFFFLWSLSHQPQSLIHGIDELVTSLFQGTAVSIVFIGADRAQCWDCKWNFISSLWTWLTRLSMWGH